MSAWINASLLLAEIETSLFEMLKGTPAAKLTPVQVHVMAELFKADHRGAMDLAKSIGRVQTSFTPILDGLELAGLVNRSMNKSDRRSVLISLTPKGHITCECIWGALKKLDEWYPDSDWTPDVSPVERRETAI